VALHASKSLSNEVLMKEDNINSIFTYCRAFLGQRRGARRWRVMMNVEAATVG